MASTLTTMQRPRTTIPARRCAIGSGHGMWLGSFGDAGYAFTHVDPAGTAVTVNVNTKRNTRRLGGRTT